MFTFHSSKEYLWRTLIIHNSLGKRHILPNSNGGHIYHIADAMANVTLAPTVTLAPLSPNCLRTVSSRAWRKLVAAESASEQQQQQHLTMLLLLLLLHCYLPTTLQLVDNRGCLGTIRHATNIKRNPHVLPGHLERRSPRRDYKRRQKRFVSVDRRWKAAGLWVRQIATRHRHHLSSVSLKCQL